MLKKYIKKIYLLNGLLLISISFVWARGLPEKVKLVYSPQEGAVSSYKTVVRAEAKVTAIDGVDIEEEAVPHPITEGIFISDEEIEKVDREGNITEVITFREVDIQLKIGDRIEKLPSSSQLKGQMIRFKTNQRGEILKSEGIELSDELKDLNWNLNDMFKPYRPVFPDKEVGVGDTWDSDFTSTLPIEGQLVKTSVNTKYQLEGFEKQKRYTIAIIDISIELETSSHALKKKDLASHDIVMRGKGKGRLYYDYTLNKMIRSEMGIDADAELVTQTFDQTKTMRMSQTISMSSELLEK